MMQTKNNRMVNKQKSHSSTHLLANRDARLVIPPLFWPANCIKVGGHVELLSDPTVNSLYCARTNPVY